MGFPIGTEGYRREWAQDSAKEEPTRLLRWQPEIENVQARSQILRISIAARLNRLLRDLPLRVVSPAAEECGVLLEWTLPSIIVSQDSTPDGKRVLSSDTILVEISGLAFTGKETLVLLSTASEPPNVPVI